MSRILSIVLFFSLMGGVLAPSSWGSCGDWLQHSGDSAVPSPSASAESDLASLPANPAVPCSGPNCGKSPAGPIPATPLPSVERQHIEAAWLRNGQFESLIPLGFVASDEPRPAPQACIDEIFRPPSI
ncbi:hypothetical protein K227x_57900 [Rubripirellula lacrimiformis]|uniref:Uncharacterized protein n=1 Tax=Rubripirellula lacrimiformis TaxID=1930273 RepID=A0A517NJZ7_9BACT|nr:hypothetical protein [Rubripirellula lacrimiformis]QDT07363.1 hypothetical protein K227x_57900 [Rubripirellula lacrimiformis]